MSENKLFVIVIVIVIVINKKNRPVPISMDTRTKRSHCNGRMDPLIIQVAKTPKSSS